MKNFKLVLVSIFSVITLCHCVSGPKDNRTVLESLNGDNYADKNVIMGVPVLTSKPIRRKISGLVSCGDGYAKSPIINAQVKVSHGKKVVATGSSTVGGIYSVFLEVDPTVSYAVEAEGTCGRATRPLPKSLTENLDGFDLALSN